MKMKLFDQSNSKEPFMLIEEPARSFATVDFSKLVTWPRTQYDQLPADEREQAYYETFLKCAQLGNVKAFTAGDVAGMPLNVLSDDEYTLLMSAAYFGKKDIVTYLLKKGLNPAFRSGTNNYDALCVTAITGQYDTAALILAARTSDENATDLQKTLSGKINPDTTDFYGQSILQIAITNHRFEFAKRWIEEQDPNLQHVDKQGRNALGTTLGIFFRIHFNQAIDSKEKDIRDENLAELEKFCIYMLDRINAFEKNEQHSILPVLAVLNTRTSLTLDKGQQTPQTEPALDAIKRIYLNTFNVAEKLYSQARVLPGVDGAGKYMHLFDKFDDEYKRYSRAVQREATANQAK